MFFGSPPLGVPHFSRCPLDFVLTPPAFLFSPPNCVCAPAILATTPHQQCSAAEKPILPGGCFISPRPPWNSKQHLPSGFGRSPPPLEILFLHSRLKVLLSRSSLSRFPPLTIQRIKHPVNIHAIGFPHRPTERRVRFSISVRAAIIFFFSWCFGSRS